MGSLSNKDQRKVNGLVLGALFCSRSAVIQRFIQHISVTYRHFFL